MPNKGNTYGNLLIRFGEGDYIGGDTFMDHGRACFSLLKHEAAVWTTYDRGGHGQLLGESVHAAGTAYGGAELAVAALWGCFKSFKAKNQKGDVAACSEIKRAFRKAN